MNCQPSSESTGTSHGSPSIHATFSREAPTASMFLTARPKSATATQTVATLASKIIELKGRRRSASAEYVLALGAMVADLLRATAYHPPRGCYRPLRANDFTGGSIGHQPFTRALRDMRRCGYVTIVEGRSAWKSQGVEGTVTRIHPTPKLTGYLADSGITVTDRYRHFSYQRVMDDIPPIQLRATSVRKWPEIIRGKRMKVDYANPIVAKYANQIRNINNHLSKQVIINHVGEKLDIALYRGFNLGDDPSHGYAKGGRIYAGYQGIERKKRNLITINGLPTVEVDISACFLTLVHYILNRPFLSNADPYVGPLINRDIVKSWVNLTIGYSNYHSKWPEKTLEKLAKDGHFNIPKRYPIKGLKDQILKHIPIVKDWVESDHTWADLFMVESQIVINAVEILAKEYNITALPLHDGLRVCVDNSELTKTVLRQSFIDITGINPIIK